MLTIQDRICHVTDDSIDKYQEHIGFDLHGTARKMLYDFMDFLLNEYDAMPISGITREDVIYEVESRYDHTPTRDEQDEVLTLLKLSEEDWLNDDLNVILPRVFGEE